MRPFDIDAACPTCRLVPPSKLHHDVKHCAAKGDAIPLRCVHAADPAEHAVWSGDLYHLAGKVYRTVTKVVDVPDKRVVLDPPPEPTEDNPMPGPVERVEDYMRKETVVDEAATLAGGEIKPPRTIPHVHRRCVICAAEWVEELPEE